MKFKNHHDIFECRRAGVSAEVIRGIIAAESSKLVMIERLWNGWFPDGYEIYRKDDISHWRFYDSPDDPQRIIQSRAGLTGNPPAFVPDLRDIPATVADLCRRGMLFAVAKERSAPGVMYLVKARKLSPRSFLAAELDADGMWTEGARFYFDAVTSIGIGGRYVAFYERLFGASAPGGSAGRGGENADAAQKTFFDAARS